MGIILGLFVLFFLGVPIGYALGIISVSEIISTMGSSLKTLQMVSQKMLGGVDSIPLIAILMFTMAGMLMMHGGMSKRLINLADALVGHRPSGMAMVSILACMFFAALTGSAIAATAAIGGIMIPIMKEKKYDDSFSCSLLACAGSIGPIIPPSIPLLLYGVIASCSVAKLFVGGIVPGILMGVALMVYSHFIGKKRHYIGREVKASRKERLAALKDSFWALLTPIIILGGIMTGIFTATESAAIAVAYSIVIGLFVYRELTIKDLITALWESAKSTGQILLIVGFASLFTWVITIQQLPQQLAAFIMSTISNKYVFLLVVNIILLIAGTFIDTTSAVVVFSPLLLPIAQNFGINFVHFGVMIAVNLTIGMCTPPLGVCLFVSGGIGKIALKDMFKDLWPQLVVLIVVLLIITYIPSTVTWLANTLVAT